MNNIVNGVVSANSNQDPEVKNHKMELALGSIVVMVIQVVLLTAIGTYLWNNSVAKVFSGVSRINSTQMYFMFVLLHLLFPKS